PFDSRLDDPLERARLRQLFKQGLDKAVGHVLPIKRDNGNGRWKTGSWFLRAERCYLIPGDSPIGLRLPLDSMPWAAAGDRPSFGAPDPTQRFAALPSYRKLQSRPAGTAYSVERQPGEFESAAWIARTALCAEPRNG